MEKTPLHNDTPGFPIQDFPTIFKDVTGIERLHLPRRKHDKRLNVLQTSLFLAHGWRANCDLQILIYDSDPTCPDPQDIARVSDYIVAYASKGNETQLKERQHLKSLILSAQETTGCQRDVQRVARQILNTFSGDKLFSKQECIVQILGLKLWDCSEIISKVSVSRYVHFLFYHQFTSVCATMLHFPLS